jgi:anthranilate synthase component 2
VKREDLPDTLEITAETDGLIMALSHKSRPMHGVQFHPESIASEHGHRVLANFLDLAVEWNTTQRK